MTDQFFDDEELEELVKRTIAEELAKLAKAEQEPKDFFYQKTAEWLNPEITDPEETKIETLEDRATRWLEMDKKPERNAFGMPIGMPIEKPDQVWEAVKEAGARIYEEHQEKQTAIENWLREAEEEIARNKKANGK